MADKPILPPSLHSGKDRALTIRADRRRAVETAIRSLLTKEEKSRASPFVSALESAYHSVKKKKNDRSTPARTLEKQLVEMAHKCGSLFDHLQKMHPNAIGAWSQAALGHAGGVFAFYQLFQSLLESEDAAERAAAALKAERHSPQLGNPGDAMAAAITMAAGFVYTRLTGKQITQSTKRGSFQAFLENVFRAYGVDANPQHCIRRHLEEIRSRKSNTLHIKD